MGNRAVWVVVQEDKRGFACYWQGPDGFWPGPIWSTNIRDAKPYSTKIQAREAWRTMGRGFRCIRFELKANR